MKRILPLFLTLCLLAALCPAAAETASSIYVKQVEGLADDFIMGMDVSSVLAL